MFGFVKVLVINMSILGMKDMISCLTETKRDKQYMSNYICKLNRVPFSDITIFQ